MLLHSPGRPHMCRPPASDSQVLGLQMCITTLGLVISHVLSQFLILFKKLIITFNLFTYSLYELTFGHVIFTVVL